MLHMGLCEATAETSCALGRCVWTLLVLLNRSIGVSHTKLVSTYCAVSLLNTNASLALEEHCTENGAR